MNTKLPSPPRLRQKIMVSRRQFVKTSALAAGSISLAGVVPAAAFGANDQIRIGVIGCGGQGTGHVHSLVKRSAEDNITVVAVSDVYQRRGSLGQKGVKRKGVFGYLTSARPKGSVGVRI